MRTLFLFLAVAVATTFIGCGGGAIGAAPTTSPNFASSSANTKSSSLSGPQTSWMVVTLPNQKLTPGWQGDAPQDCKPDPSPCGEDQRFWEEWDFSAFQHAIDSSFRSISQQGKYQGVMLLIPLTDSPVFWNNLDLMFHAAAAQGLQFQAVVFPKSKYGAEQCYLYPDNAPGMCATVPGTSTAQAYAQLIKLMDHVENLGGACTNGQSNRPISVWYGWDALPGYDVLSRFWNSLPTKGCNLRASYITWLDTPYSHTPEVAQLQQHVVGTLHQAYHVNTELYSAEQIQASYQRYAPYQTVITGFADANDTTGWSQGMCTKWKLAGQPTSLGVWNFADRDISPVENYAALIHGAMSTPNAICASSGPS